MLVMNIASLTSASGGQDHTTSRPRHAVRPRSQALRHVAYIASHPACRDDRDAPLCMRRDVRKSAGDLPDDASAPACDKVTRRASLHGMAVQIVLWARRQERVNQQAAVLK